MCLSYICSPSSFFAEAAHPVATTTHTEYDILTFKPSDLFSVSVHDSVAPFVIGRGTETGPDTACEAMLKSKELCPDTVFLIGL